MIGLLFIWGIYLYGDKYLGVTSKDTRVDFSLFFRKCLGHWKNWLLGVEYKDGGGMSIRGDAPLAKFRRIKSMGGPKGVQFGVNWDAVIRYIGPAIASVTLLILCWKLFGLVLILPLVDYTWTDHTSGNTLWSDQQNWNDGASGVPDGNDDTATFDSTWDNACTADTGYTVGSITIATGYNSTITQTAGYVIDNAGGKTGALTIGVAAATWDSNNQTLDIDGTFSGTGTFDPGTSTITCRGTTTMNSLAAITGGGTNAWTLVFATNNLTFTPKYTDEVTPHYWNITVSTDSQTVTSGGHCCLENVLDMSACTTAGGISGAFTYAFTSSTSAQATPIVTAANATFTNNINLNMNNAYNVAASLKYNILYVKSNGASVTATAAGNITCSYLYVACHDVANVATFAIGTNTVTTNNTPGLGNDGDAAIGSGSNHDGVITVSTGTLTIADAFDVTNDGTLTYTAAGTMTVTGNFTVSGVYSGSSSTVSVGSFAAEAGGSTVTMSSGTTTITSRDGVNASIRISNTCTFDDANGTIDIATALASNIDTGGKTWYTLTISGNATHTMINFAMSLDNNLTISTGTLDTGANLSLTVTSLTSITGSLVCNASTISLGSGTNGTNVVLVNNGGVLTGGSGTHTFGNIVMFNGSTTTFSSGTTTIDGRGTSVAPINTGSTPTINHGSGTIVLTQNQGTASIIMGLAFSLNNLTLNSAREYDLAGAVLLTVANNLTITQGTLDTNTNDLTVTGDTDITGTLTENASTTSHGSVTVNAAGTWSATSGTSSITSETAGGYALDIDGTITHNNGTIKIDNAGIDVKIDIIGTGTVYNLEMDVDIAKTVVWEGNTTVTNNVTIIDGIFTSDGVGDTLTVGGLMTAETNGHLGDGTETGAWVFGGLTILSGGSCTATSGTITVSGNIDNAGTFTHSSGTFVLTDAAHTLDGSWSFWHFTCAVATARTLTFDNTATFTFGGNVTINGAAGQLLTLQSDSAGVAFDFVMPAGAVKTNLSFLNVIDSDASGSHASQKPINPSTSTDGGGNTDWFPKVSGNTAMMSMMLSIIEE
jgi:hypothetical protein